MSSQFTEKVMNGDRLSEKYKYVNGHLTEMKDYDSWGSWIKYTYDYDSDGNLIKETKWDSKNNFIAQLCLE